MRRARIHRDFRLGCSCVRGIRSPSTECSFTRGNRMSFQMTNLLPALFWRPSPNFSTRGGARVDLIVLHDCEGGYEGSVRWFEMS